MPRSAALKNRSVVESIDADYTEIIESAGPPDMSKLPPIIEFCERSDNSGLALPQPLYPRQKTLLRLFFLETEQMTAFDVATIDHWANNFGIGKDRIGISPDVWRRIEMLKEEGYDHFREIVFIGGRRGGKGHLGAIMAARQMYRMILMGSPQSYYGIDIDKDIKLFVMATNFTQARINQFTDIWNTVARGPCFDRWRGTMKGAEVILRTPADERRIMKMQALGENFDREIGTVRCEAISSNSSGQRGAASFMQIYDEMAHMLTGTAGPRTAEEVYDAMTPSLDQMGIDQMIYIPTSPYTKIGRAFELYEDGLAVDQETGDPLNPDMLVVQLPSWEPYQNWDDMEATEGHVFRSAPQYDPVTDKGKLLRRLEARNPDKFRVERRAQWAETINAYLNPVVVDQIFEPLPLLGGRFPDDWDPAEADPADMRHLSIVDKGIFALEYRGHADPSKSQANFAVAIAHTEGFSHEYWRTKPDNPDEEERVEEVWPHVVFDYLKVWRPRDYAKRNYQLPYPQIEEELFQLILGFPTLTVFSYDQYGAFATVENMKVRLRRMGQQYSQIRIVEENFNERTNQERAELFKTAAGLRWIHAPRDDYYGDDEEAQSLLELELKFLQQKGDKVVKQDIGPVQTKDLSDCVMVVSAELLKDHIHRFYRRENLVYSSIPAGARGGYSTHTDPDEAMEQAMARQSDEGGARRYNWNYQSLRGRPAEGITPRSRKNWTQTGRGYYTRGGGKGRRV